jgi:hypothetical protein
MYGYEVWNYRTIKNNGLGKIQENAFAPFKLPSWYMRDETEEVNEEFYQDTG